MKQVGGECPLQGIMPTGKGTPGQEARVFLAFNVLLPLNKGKKCIYALRESSKAWQVIWVFPDVAHPYADQLAPWDLCALSDQGLYTAICGLGTRDIQYGSAHIVIFPVHSRIVCCSTGMDGFMH